MMRKCKEFIPLAAALLVVMWIAVFAGCNKLGCAEDRATDNWGFEVPVDAGAERKAEFAIGKAQDRDRGEDLHVKHTITEANRWITQTRVQLGFSVDTVPAGRQDAPKPGWSGRWTKHVLSVMEESCSFYIPLGRTETGDYVYALPRAKVWFE